MFDTIITFESGASLSEDKLKAAARKALEVIRSELTEEVQTYEAYEAVLENCKGMIRGSHIIL
mgnify:FL=1